MEEDDEIQSIHSPGDSSLSPQAPPSPPILPTNDVTVAVVKKPTAASVSSQSPSRNALALVVHTPAVTGGGGSGNRNGRGGSGGGGGGRDDCWSEEATKVLIDAWGDRFSEPGKGTLKQQHWKEVAEIVNKSRQCKYPKTDIQCKNRIDTVKKKYKQEKAKIASGDGPSKWVFFKKLESLIGASTTTAITTRASEKAPMGGGLVSSRSHLFKRQAKGTQIQGGGDLKRGSDSMRWHFRKRSASETESESESDPELEASPDSAESLPPPQPVSYQLPKRLKVDKSEGSGVGDVARAILGFTEAYEKAETAKLKLMVELEKERMKFAKEMELQRMQFLKTQLEITQSNQEEEERSRQRGDRRIVDDDDDDDDDDDNDDDDRNVKNNGNVSS
ncbi:PREDICTED: trihelix transcription factor ASIL1-like [Camelina sativa]|uniref:Trihelix transcription factor ASIL1-like n=2 Tax=Camelina sativa TaxID=90675 RepID=A0ABM0YHS9_CAMSA|nr:PREDICTED: trihelix transcription factor ASIL1-like [Camelina sativa]